MTIEAQNRECLSCGHVRPATGQTADACPRCGYVGWAYVDRLTDRERQKARMLLGSARPIDAGPAFDRIAV